MQTFYQKCAALLLALGLLFPSTTALAQMPEESSSVGKESSVDIVPPPPLDNGVVLVVWNLEACYIEAGSALDKLPLTVEVNAGHKSADGGVGEYTGIYSVGVHWNTANVDCTRPGTYDITGTLDSEELCALGLTNPDGLTAALTVAVQKRGPIETLRGKLRSMDESYMRFQLYFPLLPNDVTALYVERETEPDVWERLSIPGQTDHDGNPQTNFLEFSPKNPPEQLISYYLSPPIPQLRLRIEVVGSLYAGVSNEVEILAQENGDTLPPPPKPENKPDNGDTDGDDEDDNDDDGDDGSSGGNRDPGTQGKNDRPGKVPKEEKPNGTVEALGNHQASAPIIAAKPQTGTENSVPPAVSTASAISDVAESTPSSASNEPSAQETLASTVEKPLVTDPQSPHDKGHAGKVAALSTAILVTGAGGIYLFKIRRKP